MWILTWCREYSNPLCLNDLWIPWNPSYRQLFSHVHIMSRFGALNEYLRLFGFGVLNSGEEITAKLAEFRELKAIPNYYVQEYTRRVLWRICSHGECGLPVFIHVDDDTHLVPRNVTRRDVLKRCMKELNEVLQEIIALDSPRFVTHLEYEELKDAVEERTGFAREKIQRDVAFRS